MKRKIYLSVGITILFLGTCITPSVAIDTIKQCSMPISNGKTLYVGGSGPNNYTSIQDAIDDATDGDTVFVYNGIYYENVVVDKAINLIGEDKNTTNIDGKYSNDVVFVSVDWVNISKFTIRNSGNDNAGIEIHSSYNTIENNIIINNEAGVLFGYDDHYNNKILNNTIKSNSFWGIFAYSEPVTSKNLNIIGNEITFNNYSGIKIYKCPYSTISYNTISNNNGEGINMQVKCHFSLISNNIITRNGFFGLWICSMYDCTVRNNYFEKNGYEISFYGASRHLVYHNNIIDGSDNECEDEGTSNWDNGYPSGGNYWNSYDGNDNFSGPNQDIPGSDGIGDTPYSIPGGDNEDRYPLMEPWAPKNPIANFTYSVNESSVLFNGSSSYDPDGIIVSYDWDFGDGTSESGEITYHKYYEVGNYNVTLTVTDDDG